LRRYLQRHWLPLSAAALVLLSLSVGIALALREAQRADAAAIAARSAESEARDQAARAQAINRFVVELFRAQLPGRPRDEMPSTRELVDRGIEQARDPAAGPPDLRADLMLSLGQIVLARQQFDEARALSREARALLGESAAADPATWARALHLEADSFRKQRRYADLKPALDEAIAFLELRAPDDPQRYEMLRERGSLELFMENPDEAERRLLALRRDIEGRTDLGNLPMRLSGDLANVYGMQGRMREAAAMHAEILATKRASPDTPAVSIATSVFNLGGAAFASGELVEARSRYEEALALMADIDAPLQVRAAALQGLSRLEHALGHGDAALRRVREAAQEWARNLALADPDQDFFGAYHGGRILADLGRVDEARERLGHAVSRMRASQDAPPARIAAAIARLAQMDCASGAPAQGRQRLREARAGLAGASTEAIEEADAACALAEGRAEAALELLQSRHPRAAAQADDPDFDRMRVETLLAESLQASGRAEAAQVLAAELSARLDRIGAVPDHALRARLATLQSASD
jgi:tetratricopeptide (TPR) repeat protein